MRRSQQLAKLDSIKLVVNLWTSRREAQEKISDYVRNFSVNTVFALTLFEQGTHRSEVKSLIRQCSTLLSYEKDVSMAKIRERLLHDYQSLESL